MALSGVDVMAFFDKNQEGKSSKVNGRIWPDASGKYGGVISWDNGQTWVRETLSVHVQAFVQKQAAVESAAKEKGVDVNTTPTVNLNPTTRPDQFQVTAAENNFDKHGEEHEVQSNRSSSDDYQHHQWKKFAHAAPTHIPEVLEYLYRNEAFYWQIVDISHITPLRAWQEVWIPRIRIHVLKLRFNNMVSRVALWLHSKIDKTQKREVSEIQELTRSLKDLNFETCTSADLRAFFEDKTFKKDVVHMLQAYLDISLKQIALKRDEITDQMVMLSFYVCIAYVRVTKDTDH